MKLIKLYCHSKGDNMKSLIIIWLLVLVVLVGGLVYMNHVINELVKAVPETRVAVLRPISSLEVVNSNSSNKDTLQGSYIGDFTSTEYIQSACGLYCLEFGSL